MKDNKSTTILLTVIGIATLLVAVVGATFAYFSATVKDTYQDGDNDGKDVVVEAATIGTVTFNHGYTIDLCDDENANCLIYPGAEEAKQFTVTADANSTVPVEYTVFLQIDENSFITDNLGYIVSAETNNLGTEKSTIPTDFATTRTSLNSVKEGYVTKIKLGTAILGTAGAVDTWTLNVKLENLPTVNQKDDQGKTFKARILVEATNNIYSETYSTTQANG